MNKPLCLLLSASAALLACIPDWSKCADEQLGDKAACECRAPGADPVCSARAAGRDGAADEAGPGSSSAEDASTGMHASAPGDASVSGALPDARASSPEGRPEAPVVEAGIAAREPDAGAPDAGHPAGGPTTPTCLPGTEVCDERDNDCDGQTDEDDVCRPACFPAAEVCDQKDNDCDGMVDELSSGTPWWSCDGDGDGWLASSARKVQACAKPAATSDCASWKLPATGEPSDCNDADKNYHPGADFGLLAGSGNGDLNCDGTVEKYTEPNVTTQPFLSADGYFAIICDTRATGHANLAALQNGVCPCYAPLKSDGVSYDWVTEFACTKSSADRQRLRHFVNAACDVEQSPSGGEKIYWGVQLCK